MTKDDSGVYELDIDEGEVKINGKLVLRKIKKQKGENDGL